mmetsp:Transcript_33821/g.71152  ORF Transcript_33821/g.71152 Transcript_33821/m.71152 type:complete len:240 (-) Transcript_33821:650-1369(-)
MVLTVLLVRLARGLALSLLVGVPPLPLVVARAVRARPPRRLLVREALPLPLELHVAHGLQLRQRHLHLLAIAHQLENGLLAAVEPASGDDARVEVLVRPVGNGDQRPWLEPARPALDQLVADALDVPLLAVGVDVDHVLLRLARLARFDEAFLAGGVLLRQLWRSAHAEQLRPRHVLDRLDRPLAVKTHALLPAHAAKHGLAKLLNRHALILFTSCHICTVLYICTIALVVSHLVRSCL